MKWRIEEPAPVKTRGATIWDTTIPEDLLRQMRLNPGVSYQLLDDNHTPLKMANADQEALRSACPKPFRVQSRAVDINDRDGLRYIFVSFDPGHWERTAGWRKRKAERMTKK